jgi:hypothetical protein
VLRQVAVQILETQAASQESNRAEAHLFKVPEILDSHTMEVSGDFRDHLA